jgi:tripartite ATP-independent transporter DctP family solute receptor
MLELGTDIHRLLQIGVLALGVVSMSSPAQAQGRQFRLGIVTTPVHPWNQELAAINEALKHESNGRFSLAVFPTAQLGPEASMMQQLQAGTLDMAWVSTTELANWIPEFGALQAPFLVKNVQQAARLFDVPVTLSILDHLPKIGVVGLGLGLAGMRQIYTRDAASSLADLKGKKIRIIPSAPPADFFTALGMTPAPIPFREIYNALATGQVDAIDMDFEGTADYKFYDHLDTLLLTNHGILSAVVLVSAKIWSDLSPGDQGVIRSVMQRHLETMKQSIIAQEKDFLEQLRRSPLKIVELEAATFEPAVAEWDKIWLPKAPILKELRQTAAQL